MRLNERLSKSPHLAEGTSPSIGNVQGHQVFSQEEKFGLTSQIRGAAASVPTNIAEGCGRSGDSDFRRFLDIAMGSASELEYLLYLSGELGFMETADSRRLLVDVAEVKRMLSSLIVKLRADR